MTTKTRSNFCTASSKVRTREYLQARLQADVQNAWHQFCLGEKREARMLALTIRHRCKMSKITLSENHRLTVAIVLAMTEPGDLFWLFGVLPFPVTRKSWKEFAVGIVLVVLFALACGAVGGDL
jgi:hypothetical protein